MTNATPHIQGFEYRRQTVGDASYEVALGGRGPAVILLHGYPQTHFCWHQVAPALAETHTVMAPDLRGYGATSAPGGGPRGEGYSKREMAAEIVSLADAFGIERFAVVGHDRGGRVAYRMALDHPQPVERLALLNIVPTVEQFERVNPDNAIGYWPWFFLAQPAPFPERLIAGAPDHYVRSLIEDWAAHPEKIGPEAVRRYVDAFTEDTIASTCADYRASFYLDRPLDAEDRRTGRRISCPVLAIWGELDEGFSGGDTDEETAPADGPVEVWSRWADEVEGAGLPAGHFIPEEAPSELLGVLDRFLPAGLSASAAAGSEQRA